MKLQSYILRFYLRGHNLVTQYIGFPVTSTVRFIIGLILLFGYVQKNI